uniref:Uncharacterized protein n=1 Tax=Anguilla anguilla TaxID=7936 RepID=A0A0E9XQD9_ANGAN
MQYSSTQTLRFLVIFDKQVIFCFRCSLVGFNNLKSRVFI